MNVVNLLGRIATDLKLETLKSKDGKEFEKTDFILAVKNNKKDEKGNFLADFITITAMNTIADNLVKYQKKGNQIVVEGRIQVGSWTDNDNKKQYRTKIIASKIYFVENISK